MWKLLYMCFRVQYSGAVFLMVLGTLGFILEEVAFKLIARCNSLASCSLLLCVGAIYWKNSVSLTALCRLEMGRKMWGFPAIFVFLEKLIFVFFDLESLTKERFQRNISERRIVVECIISWIMVIKWDVPGDL